MDSHTTEIDVTGGQTKYLLLASDLHLLASDFDEKMFKRDFDQAASLGARISINGDVADLILPRDMKRFHPSVYEETGMDGVLNQITEMSFERLRPYADLIDMISPGNHEDAAVKHHHYDILRSVITLLNQHRDRSLPPIHQGDYRGFQRYRLTISGGKREGMSRSFTIFRHHGSGGSAPVTKGMIDFNRLRQLAEAVDLYWIGHKHKKIQDRDAASPIYLGPNGKMRQRRVQAVMTGPYKQPYVESDPDKTGNNVHYGERGYSYNSQGGLFVALHLFRSGVEYDITERPKLWQSAITN